MGKKQATPFVVNGYHRPQTTASQESEVRCRPMSNVKKLLRNKYPNQEKCYGDFVACSSLRFGLN